MNTCVWIIQDTPSLGRSKKDRKIITEGFLLGKVSSGSVRLVSLTDPICSATVQNLRILSTHYPNVFTTPLWQWVFWKCLSMNLDCFINPKTDSFTVLAHLRAMALNKIRTFSPMVTVYINLYFYAINRSIKARWCF